MIDLMSGMTFCRGRTGQRPEWVVVARGFEKHRPRSASGQGKDQRRRNSLTVNYCYTMGIATYRIDDIFLNVHGAQR
jgi:hypothetical protein